MASFESRKKEILKLLNDASNSLWKKTKNGVFGNKEDKECYDEIITLMSEIEAYQPQEGIENGQYPMGLPMEMSVRFVKIIAYVTARKGVVMKKQLQVVGGFCSKYCAIYDKRAEIERMQRDIEELRRQLSQAQNSEIKVNIEGRLSESDALLAEEIKAFRGEFTDFVKQYASVVGKDVIVNIYDGKNGARILTEEEIQKMIDESVEKSPKKEVVVENHVYRDWLARGLGVVSIVLALIAMLRGCGNTRTTGNGAETTKGDEPTKIETPVEDTTDPYGTGDMPSDTTEPWESVEDGETTDEPSDTPEPGSDETNPDEVLTEKGDILPDPSKYSPDDIENILDTGEWPDIDTGFNNEDGLFNGDLQKLYKEYSTKLDAIESAINLIREFESDPNFANSFSKLDDVLRANKYIQAGETPEQALERIRAKFDAHKADIADLMRIANPTDKDLQRARQIAGQMEWDGQWVDNVIDAILEKYNENTLTMVFDMIAWTNSNTLNRAIHTSARKFGSGGGTVI